MAVKIGAITVGQSPRADILPEIAGLCGEVVIEERGALDGLSLEDIGLLAPTPGDYILVTRLRDGTSVHIAKKHIIDRMQRHIDDLIARGAAGILLLCTGEFPPFACGKPVLYPQKLLQHFVAGVAGERAVGVLTPDISQVGQAGRRWVENGARTVVVEPATPYGDPARVAEAAVTLKQRGAELIVMDCIGYTCAMKEQATGLTGLPAVLPRTVAARAVAELFG